MPKRVIVADTKKNEKKKPQLKPLQGVVVRIKEILRQRVHIKRNISGKLLSNALFDMWFSLYALLQKKGKIHLSHPGSFFFVAVFCPFPLFSAL